MHFAAIAGPCLRLSVAELRASVRTTSSGCRVLSLRLHWAARMWMRRRWCIVLGAVVEVRINLWKRVLRLLATALYLCNTLSPVAERQLMDEISHRSERHLWGAATASSPETLSGFNIGGCLGSAKGTPFRMDKILHRWNAAEVQKGTPFEWTKFCTGERPPIPAMQH